ncbi:uncharacterized protein BDV17DRAFT_254644 [Aspergillus undulatus]|uniref:uncharacterized protein n=1 Tax=Aspergillus undulatus TaxID=1810928 RepID=UPI003CCCF9CB
MILFASTNHMDLPQHLQTYTSILASFSAGRLGPGACGRVSCSYDAAIWWCNDVGFVRSLRCQGSVAGYENWLIHAV